MWKPVKVELGSRSLSGFFHAPDRLSLAHTEVPESLTIDGASYQILSSTNVGGRNETLELKVKRDEQVPSRNKRGNRRGNSRPKAADGGDGGLGGYDGEARS